MFNLNKTHTKKSFFLFNFIKVNLHLYYSISQQFYGGSGGVGNFTGSGNKSNSISDGADVGVGGEACELRRGSDC